MIAIFKKDVAHLWFGPIRRDLLGTDVFVPAVPVAYIQRSFDLGPLRLSDAIEQ
jgi:hypothetical protein